MKKKMAVLITGVVMGILGLLGSTRQVYATELPAADVLVPTVGVAVTEPLVNVTPGMEYLTMNRDTKVHTMPGTSWQEIGNLRAGQPAISFGNTDNGWKQIYYIGQIGYIPGDAARPYEIPEAVPQQPVSINGEIKINALGDSITYGDKLSNQVFAYPHRLGAACGAVKVNNYGWNGSAVGGIHPDKFIERYMAMDRDANLILVFGGTNDYAGYREPGTPIGKIGDTSQECFYGALNLMMCGLKQMYPDAEIVFMTPLKRVGYMRRNQKGYCLNQYVTAINEMANFYGIRVVDLFNEPELDFSSKKNLYLVDGLHPNEMGQALVSVYLYRTLFENN